MEQDFSEVVNVAIPQNQKVAREENLGKAIENLLTLEKQTRQAGDAVSTGRILETVVELCHELKDFKALKENIVLLSKRRGQLKAAIKRMVKRSMSFLPSLPHDIKMDLLDTLLKVTEGKIFVEKQGARLTMILAQIKEQEGKAVEAATILQEVQVETFGSMKKKEKTDFILEQMRLCLLKKDFVRTQIISRKINTRVLDDKDFQEQRIKYNTLMIDFYHNDSQYLDIYRCYYQIYTTPSVQENSARWQEYLKLCVLYIILSPYTNEQNDLIHRLAEDKNLKQLPQFKALLKKFLTLEVMYWTEVESQKAILNDLKPMATHGEQIWKVLHDRVTEHSIRVVAKYYNKITLKRLAELLELTPKQTEKHLYELVTLKQVFAKIDRPNGTVNFVKAQDSADILNEWSADVSSLLSLMDKACHLIQRETMVHGITDADGVDA